MSLTEYTLTIEAPTIIQIPEHETRNLKDLELYEFDDRYVATKDGNVFRVKNRKYGMLDVVKMSPYQTRDKYIEYVLTTKKGFKKHIQAQRIIAFLFLPRDKTRNFVNHKDGNRTNNHVENLEFVTHSENIIHSWRYLRNNPNIKRW